MITFPFWWWVFRHSKRMYFFGYAFGHLCIIMTSRGCPGVKITTSTHDDVIKWKHFPRYWPFVRGVHRSRWIHRTKACPSSPLPVNSPHKGQWRGALMFSLICARMNDWVNNREAGELRCHHGHYDVSVMYLFSSMHRLTSKLIITGSLRGGRWISLTKGPQCGKRSHAMPSRWICSHIQCPSITARFAVVHIIIRRSVRVFTWK